MWSRSQWALDSIVALPIKNKRAAVPGSWRQNARSTTKISQASIINFIRTAANFILNDIKLQPLPFWLCIITEFNTISLSIRKARIKNSKEKERIKRLEKGFEEKKWQEKKINCRETWKETRDGGRRDVERTRMGTRSQMKFTQRTGAGEEWWSWAKEKAETDVHFVNKPFEARAVPSSWSEAGSLHLGWRHPGSSWYLIDELGLSR